MAIVLSSKSRRATKKLQADQDTIATSLKRIQITAAAESESRKMGLEDLLFSIGTGQWDAAVKANREIEGKPCLTLNRIPTFIRQYTGQQRQNRPAMIVSPIGDGADEEVAKMLQGLLRHTENVSMADVVYDNSYDKMLRIGWAPWRIKTDYVSETSFDQEPYIEEIENAFAAFLSPVRRPDGNDPLWAHVVEYVQKDEYKEKYPNSELARLNFPASSGLGEPNWVTRDGCVIAEYWWLELTRKNLVMLPDGSTHFKDELHKSYHEFIENEREVVTRKVRCIKHNAVEVLEKYDYVGKYIPLPEVSGVRLNVNGKIYRAGMVRDARDAQRIYDFMVTSEAEQINLTGKDPLYVAEGSITGREDEYRQMNRKNYPFLYYKARDEDGNELPPPTRANREPPIQAMQALVQQADYDMKAVIGIFGTGPGESATPNESEFAVLTRSNQTETGAVNWSDNLSRTIRWQGVILLDLWPKLADQARIQRIINPDDSATQVVMWNSKIGDPEQQQALINRQAIKKVYDLGVGQYDVTLSSGPMYQSARKETFKALTIILAEKPDLFPILGDIWAKNADFPDGHILADRFKKMLPPELQDNASSDDKKAQIVQLQSALAQIQQQNAQMVAELQRAVDTIRTKRLELESKERIALMNNEAGLVEALIKASGEAGAIQMQGVIDMINHRMEVLHNSMSIEQDAGDPPPTPELPGKVEPKILPVTPAAPTIPVPGTT